MKAKEDLARKKADEESDIDPWILMLRRKYPGLSDEELKIQYTQDMVEEDRKKKAKARELKFGLKRKQTFRPRVLTEPKSAPLA
jgi:predicted nucleotidyltransferase